MLPTFHDDDYRCHHKDKKLKICGQIQRSGMHHFLFYFMPSADPLSEKLFFFKTRDDRKRKMLYTVACTRLSSANVKSWGQFRRNRIRRGGAINWGPHQSSLGHYSLKFANTLIFGSTNHFTAMLC